MRLGLFGIVGLATMLAAIFMSTQEARACTSFSAQGKQGVLVAKSYDWHDGSGYLMVNQRGRKKFSLPLRQSAKRATWISKYASLTFNQAGYQMPLGGMNEAGLVVEILWLDESVFPRQSPKPVLNELEWIQYQLDRFGSVEEVVKNASKTEVEPGYAKAHWMVCDKTGQCAAVEYLNGKMRVTAMGKMDPPVLTNHDWVTSKKYLQTLKRIRCFTHLFRETRIRCFTHLFRETRSM